MPQGRLTHYDPVTLETNSSLQTCIDAIERAKKAIEALDSEHTGADPKSVAV